MNKNLNLAQRRIYGHHNNLELSISDVKLSATPELLLQPTMKPSKQQRRGCRRECSLTTYQLSFVDLIQCQESGNANI